MYLSNGDFNFPFEWWNYLLKHFYMWVYQTGTPNPDGIIRLPGRLLNFLVFAMTDNIIVGYFYIFLCLGVAFFAFWYFQKVFLHINDKLVRFIGSAFFAVNPIFLGNLSKTGLILAVAMLPLALALLKLWFSSHKARYFILAILCLNVAFLHPFTFVIDAAVVGFYAVYKLIIERAEFKKNIFQLIPLGIVALLLNIYFSLPLVSLGTLDKSAVLDDINASEIDYSKLVDIANTGDIFTGLSLSKDVLKDYEFYDSTYEPYYFVGVFLMYALIFGAYCWIISRVAASDKKKFVLSMIGFLVLVLSSVVHYMNIGTIMKWLIALPGGWIFRAPLKWQLYIPLFICIALVIALKYLRNGTERRIAYTGLAISFVLANAYLVVDIYNRLLVPRQISTFSSLQSIDMKANNMLFVSTQACSELSRYQPALMTEFNQIMSSKDVQLKRTDLSGMQKVNLSNFDYVMLCKFSGNTTTLVEDYGFSEADKFADKAFVLYKNQDPKPYVYVAPYVVDVPNSNNLVGRNAFIKDVYGSTVPFVSAQESGAPTVNLQDPFDANGVQSAVDGKVESVIKLSSSTKRTIYIKDMPPLYYRINNDSLDLAVSNKEGYIAAVPGDYQKVELPMVDGSLKLAFDDPSFDYKNLLSNPSFETGLWQDTVDDCYQFDKSPRIRQGQVNDGSEGAKSLELAATSHVACTGSEPMQLEEGADYLLSFDYVSPGGRYAGYRFADANGETLELSERLKMTSDWATISETFTAPEGVNEVDLKFYAYPNTEHQSEGVARYDNVHVVKIPKIQSKFFMVDDNAGETTSPVVSYTSVDPTKKTIKVENVRNSFFVGLKESYHKSWELKLADGSDGELLATTHIPLDFVVNGWYIDAAEVCTNSIACTKHQDGSYTIEFVAEFVPQKWFYVGLGISVTTLMGCILWGLWVRFWPKKGTGPTRPSAPVVVTPPTKPIVPIVVAPKPPKPKRRLIQ